jgi:trimeric autotransporter adhesin
MVTQVTSSTTSASQAPPQTEAAMEQGWLAALQRAQPAANHPIVDTVLPGADVPPPPAAQQTPADETAAANQAVSKWEAANPNAGQQSQALVQSAGLILSDLTQISGGSGNLTLAQLQSYANNNPNSDLGQAAKLWSQPGMFSLLDMAGDDIATSQPDQIIDAKNISSWISNLAPTNDVDFANTLNQAALESTVAGVDTSNLTGDVLANPQNYNGQQKTAVMVQLSDLLTKLDVGDQEGDWQAGLSYLNLTVGGGINPNFSKVQSAVQNAINQLSQDPQVQAYIASSKPLQLQFIAKSDGNVWNAVQSFYNGSFSSGQALTDDLNASNGNQVTGVETFVQQASIYDEALGENGNLAGILNPPSGGGLSKVQQIVQDSGQEQNLQNAFTNLMANGAGQAGVSQAAAALVTALDPSFVQNYLTNVTDSIFNNAGPNDLAVAFGDSNGNFDPAKAQQILQQLQQQDPALFTTSDGQTLPPDKMVSLAKQLYDLIRNGLKVQDAFNKTTITDLLGKVFDKPDGSFNDAYKNGALHLISAFFGGGVLAAKAAEGAGSPQADASIAASAIQMVGTLTEGLGKYGGTSSTVLTWFGGAADPAAAKAALKDIESSGKLLGGLGSYIGGALSIFSGIGDLQNGDVADGAVSIATGGASTLAGIASTAEGGAALLSNAGLIEAPIAETVAAASSVIGLASTVVGIVGTAGLEIYQLVQAGENDTTFTSQVLPILQQYGLTGGPIQASDEPQTDPVGGVDDGNGPH